MSNRFWQEDIECMPLPQLARFQEDRLRQSDVIKRAYASILYRERWQRAGIAPQLIRSRADLKAVPFVTGLDLKRSFEAHPIDDLVNAKNVRLWFCTSGTTGSPKWIPYGDNDISLFEQIVLRDFYVYDAHRTKHRFLVLTTAAPFIADGASHLSIFAEVLEGLQLEHILVVANGIRESLGLAHARKVDVLFAFPSVAMRIAENLAAEAKNEVKRRFKERKDLASLAAMLLTKVKRIQVRDILKFKYALFSGEALAPYRQAIIDSYGLEPFEIYTFTEFPCFNIECPAHNGIHLWIDTCIAEVIPQGELDKEESNPGYVPEALFLDEAEEGMVGEYVVTTFGQALPLIRYRTSDLIRIVSTAPCDCGRTHPRVKVLRRLDDVVNMGLIRFSILELEARLADVSQAGRITGWQLRLEREGYKPKPVLLIESDRAAVEHELVDEVRARILDIEALRIGCETGIVAQPDIRLVPEINEERTATGKVKRIVYSSNW